MSGMSLLPVFMIGLLGGVHCVGMCGGIVGALSGAPRSRQAWYVVRSSVRWCCSIP
jgi:sulfite exporter TauE/SafE